MHDSGFPASTPGFPKAGVKELSPCFKKKSVSASSGIRAFSDYSMESDGCFTVFTGSDPDRILNIIDEDLSVADLAGFGLL